MRKNRANLIEPPIVREGSAIKGSQLRKKFDAGTVEPSRKRKSARSICVLFQSPEAPMAVTNLQNLVLCVANIHGVVVTGTRKESKRAAGSFPATFLSIPSLMLDGPFPTGTDPDNQGVLRAGRSASRLGVEPCARTSSYHRELPAMPWSMAKRVRG
jgi:hypothetical protein